MADVPSLKQRCR